MLNHIGPHPRTSLLLPILMLTTALQAQDLDADFFTPVSSLGGYGELHYNHSQSNGTTPASTLDFHRFVLFFSHAWTPNWSLKAELEVEHNFVKNGQGELELEQAFVDYHHSPTLGFQAGVVLVGAGFLNETHEPPLFFGVERADYHSSLIPTTWFGNGAVLYGKAFGIDYRMALMEGLDGTRFSPASGIRGGRQKGYKADASQPLLNLKLEKNNSRGLLLGASLSHTEAPDTLDGSRRANPTTLSEVHVRYQFRGWLIQGEGGQIHYSQPELVSGIKSSRGFYADLGYDLARFLGLPGKLQLWLRYSDLNMAAETTTATAALGPTHHSTSWQSGLHFRPIPQVVYKLDYGQVLPEQGEAILRFNLGVGYQF